MKVQPVPRSSLRTITSEQPAARSRSSRHPTRFPAATSSSGGSGRPALRTSCRHRRGLTPRSGPREQLVDLAPQVLGGEAAGDPAGAAAVPGHEPGLGEGGHRPARRHPAAQALLVVDGRVGRADLVEELRRLRADVGGVDPDDRDRPAGLGVGLAGVLEGRHLLPAGHAPAGPEVDHHDPAPEGVEVGLELGLGPRDQRLGPQRLGSGGGRRPARPAARASRQAEDRNQRDRRRQATGQGTIIGRRRPPPPGRAAPRERNPPHAKVALQAAPVPAAAPSQAQAVAALGRSHHRRLPAPRARLHPAVLHADPAVVHQRPGQRQPGHRVPAPHCRAAAGDALDLSGTDPADLPNYTSVISSPAGDKAGDNRLETTACPSTSMPAAPAASWRSTSSPSAATPPARARPAAASSAGAGPGSPSSTRAGASPAPTSSSPKTAATRTSEPSATAPTASPTGSEGQLNRGSGLLDGVGIRRSTIFSAQWRGGTSVPLRSRTSCSPQVSQANTSRVPSSATSTGGPVGPLVVL